MTILPSVSLDYTRRRVLINGVWWHPGEEGIAVDYLSDGRTIIMTLLGVRFRVDKLITILSVAGGRPRECAILPGTPRAFSQNIGIQTETPDRSFDLELV